MKIKFIKFFQYVDIPVGNHDAFRPQTSANSTFHDLILDGNFVKIVHRDSGCSVMANLYNVSYFRTEDEPADTKPEAGAKGRAKAKGE